METPHVENRITTGNVISVAATLLTLIGMGAAVTMWSGRIDQRMVESEKRIETNAREIAANEIRIRSIENRGERQEVHLALILEMLRKIEAQMEAMRPPMQRE